MQSEDEPREQEEKNWKEIVKKSIQVKAVGILQD